MSTPLTDRLVARVAATGPMTIAEYMTECLLHPEFGYYTTRDPLGAAGDFVTAPEISQMFGELVGLALAQAWIDQDRPAGALLVELGPGRGTLMRDALRAMSAATGDALSPVLVEASPVLRAHQQKTLGGVGRWVERLEDVPEAPIFLIANEFFDALPIRQFLKAEAGWRERVVGVTDGALAFGLTDAARLEGLPEDAETGTLLETCAPAQALMEEIARRIAAHGGAALVIDYGREDGMGDTFQAVHAHEKVPPLESPGTADLTAQVNFAALKAAADAVATHGPVTQGIFLERLGITARAQALARSLDEPGIEALVAAHRRLTHPDEMGSLFQVLGLTPEGAPPLAGTL